MMPAPATSFDGMSNVPFGGLPPDTVGDVGPNRYVQQVNTRFQVFSKSGTTLAGPSEFRDLFGLLPASSTCRTGDLVGGDPITLYDPIASRFLLSSFATTTAPYHQCLAVSKTPDPAGDYWVYDFVYPFAKFNDYPKAGVWPDGFYFSFNQFDTNGSFLGAAVTVYDKARMYAGQAATQVGFDLSDGAGPEDPDAFTLLPADVDGSVPPSGSPNVYVGFSGSSLDVWEFHTDFVVPANSTLVAAASLPVAPADLEVCVSADDLCVPQPGTATRLDAVSYRLMQRNAYRNFGDRESMVFNHTVDAGSGQSGTRWYELRKTTATWSIHQQGTLESASDGGTPDGIHRWMGSAAQDKDGNIAVGYSASSSSVFPSIRYAGRVPTDPPGTLPQGEATLMAGAGSQTDPSGRWGDYSALSVDPSDDCTFWYTNEYYAATSSRNWKTRIGTFRFPSCGQTTSSALTVQDVSVAEGATATIAITANPAPTSAITVSVASVDGTATAGTDYTAVPSTQITIPANASTASVPVQTLQDSIQEPSETFFLNLSAPSSNATIADGQGVATIVDDDASNATLAISNVTVTEGNTGTSSANFTVTKGGSTSQTATVQFATADETASAGVDYAAQSGTLTFAPSETTKTIAVPVFGDTAIEPNETFVVNLSSPTNATIVDSHGVATIVDDDAPPPTRFINVTDDGANEGDAAVFRATLTEPCGPGESVTIPFDTRSFTSGLPDGTATEGADYVRTQGTVVIGAGESSRTFQIPTNEDFIDEPHETFAVYLGTPTGSCAATVNDGQGEGTILDDDVAGTTVNIIKGKSRYEGSHRRTTDVLFKVFLNEPTTRVVRVTVTTEDGSALDPSDYDGGSGEITFEPGVQKLRLVVRFRADRRVEPDEEFYVRLSNAKNASIGQSLATIQILNDD